LKDKAFSIFWHQTYRSSYGPKAHLKSAETSVRLLVPCRAWHLDRGCL